MFRRCCLRHALVWEGSNVSHAPRPPAASREASGRAAPGSQAAFRCQKKHRGAANRLAAAPASDLARIGRGRGTLRRPNFLRVSLCPGFVAAAALPRSCLTITLGCLSPADFAELYTGSLEDAPRRLRERLNRASSRAPSSPYEISGRSGLLAAVLREQGAGAGD
jgi:hypothetical protein